MLYVFGVLSFIATFIGGSLQAVPLGSYGANSSLVSVSGISAGAAFSVQFHVAYSSEVMGVGVVAGVPYYCAQNTLGGAELCMYSPYLTRVNELIQVTDDNAASNSVDDTSNLEGAKVFVYAGKFDTVVYPQNGQNVEEYYTNYGSDILTEFTIGSEHCQPTVDYGNNCAFLASPYISKCDYNAAYVMMNHFYGNLVEPTDTVSLTGDFYEFDQTEFITGSAADIFMDTFGYAYVPANCQTNRGCRFHIAFHGCKQGSEFIDDEYARNAGYNEVGELNDIIIIYPQVIKSGALGSNPNGCYDWWGYIDKNYATNEGPQMAAVHSMLQRVVQ
ncbi:hypothetical protein CHUAL_003962 [Chamberlinius hualienensis]